MIDGPEIHRPRIIMGASDSVAIVGRNMLRLGRAPDQMVFTVVSPILFTLLFTYIFGGAIRQLGNTKYLDYLLPGIIVMAAMFTSGNTGFSLAEDGTSGFLDRLRSLPMVRGAVVAGRVCSDAITNVVEIGIIVIVGMAVGYRTSSAIGLICGIALVVAFAVSTSLLFGYIGLNASSAQAVNAATFPIIFLLTFASSAFVPPKTMPTWLQAFANHQPVSVVIDCVRALTLSDLGPAQRSALFGGQSTSVLIVQALAWILGLGVIFGTLAMRRFGAPSE
jgi:ABC-2 type transport system permease protein/oleandomycin transport system permease protein